MKTIRTTTFTTTQQRQRRRRHEASGRFVLFRSSLWFLLLLAVGIIYYLRRVLQLSISIKIETFQQQQDDNVGSSSASASASILIQQKQKERFVRPPKSWKKQTPSQHLQQIATSKQNRVASQQLLTSPPSTTTTNVESFSACLLVMDENHRLPEWLAYHYYMLPLRQLVILSDPRARTSPWEIIQRWKSFMTIELWTDQDIGLVIKNKHSENNSSNNNNNNIATMMTISAKKKLEIHRARQNSFYAKCLHHFQKQNQTWVATHDVDEYLYLDPKELPDAMDRMAHPGSVLSFVHEWAATRTRSCFTLWRTYFGAAEAAHDVVQRHIPTGFNGSDFETLRFLQRASHTSTRNGPPKSFVRVSTARLQSQTFGIHQLLPECKPYGISPPLRIRHYIGSWESFSSRRDDARVGAKRSREYWEFQAGIGTRTDDAVRLWLQGFVQQVGGIDEARPLLYGVGQLSPPSVSSFNMTEWSMTTSNFQIEHKKRDDFSSWLRKKFHMKNLPNGTFVVQRKTPEELELQKLKTNKKKKKKKKPNK